MKRLIMVVVPNLIVHEVEALLFSDPAVLAQTPHLLPPVRDEMVQVARAFASPEHINDQDPPGKRLETLTKHHGGKYKKKIDGPAIAIQIGLAAIRARCSHLDGWLKELERRA